MSQPPIPRSILYCLLVVAVSVHVLGQSSELTECTRAFYRGEFVHTGRLAERQRRTHPNAVPVRLLLARALLTGKSSASLRGVSQGACVGSE